MRENARQFDSIVPPHVLPEGGHLKHLCFFLVSQEIDRNIRFIFCCQQKNLSKNSYFARRSSIIFLWGSESIFVYIGFSVGISTQFLKCQFLKWWRDLYITPNVRSLRVLPRVNSTD